MKDKIAGIARGRIEYELPRISLSKDRIVASVEIGRRLSGRVSISNDAEKSMKGLVCSDNRMVEPVTNQFVGVSNNIEYVIHAESLENLTSVDGALTFITDCGEIELPYHIDVVAPTMPFGAEKIETPEQFAHFACGIFDEWVRQDVGRIFVQLFDATLACWVGQMPGICTMAPMCGHSAVIEHNGDVYSCDHFVFPEYRLGNIGQESITAMMYSERQRAFGRAKRDSLPTQCRECQWLFACNGGCPKDRFCRTAEGEAGLNYFCEAYLRFFKHVAPYMDFMKAELQNERPPANVMAWAAARDKNLL